jgi:mannose-6-phosphate isomerase-like protein (cupin superfamily)
MTESTTTSGQQLFNLTAPLLAAGREDHLRAACDGLTITVKVYASGGENGLHGHKGEDHSFIVLAGEATFSFGDGATAVLGPHEGVLIPRGTLYRFVSSSDDNLVMLRAGAPVSGPAWERVDADGNDFPGDSLANFHVEPVRLDGKFFAAGARDFGG